ncbi:MAG: hypothetical protein P9M13_03920 [Candidatus Ancaeobacter aquaticus]|nr:hypothetical protein [Candidatus Ancaeobacter aquaticus]
MNDCKHNLPKGRLAVGIIIFIIGQAVPLAIPFVSATSIPAGVKAVMSSILFFVIPQIFIFWSVAVLGKPGYDYIKSMVAIFFKKYGPVDEVGPKRYKFGLILFLIPIFLAWMAPYCGDMIPGYENHGIAYAVTGDIMLIVSIFVLGGGFWDKIRSLFIRESTACFADNKTEQ